MPANPRQERRRRTHLASLVVASLAGYALGSGPMLATAFWLREATGWNGFYAVVWLYAPLWFVGLLDPDGLLAQYIEWWVNLFGTVGPG